MKVITIESEAYKALVRKIERIEKLVREAASAKPAELEPDPTRIWLSTPEAVKVLKISSRTLQRMRSAGRIAYSIKCGRVQYTLAEVRRVLAGEKVPSVEEREADYIGSMRQSYRRGKVTNSKTQRP